MSDEQTAYDKLNDQQKIFVDAIMEFAATSATVQKAAEKAGYSYVHGRRLVTKSYIQEALSELRSDLEKEAFYTRTHLLNDLLTVKEKSMTKGEHANVISSLDKLGKMLGAYTDKVEHSGEVNGIMGIEIVFDKDLIDGDEE